MNYKHGLTGVSLLSLVALLAAPPPPAAKAWGTAALIETNNAGSAYVPQIAMEGNGNAIAVWEQSDGTRIGIWASSYR